MSVTVVDGSLASCPVNDIAIKNDSTNANRNGELSDMWDRSLDPFARSCPASIFFGDQFTVLFAGLLGCKPVSHHLGDLDVIDLMLGYYAVIVPQFEWDYCIFGAALRDIRKLAQKIRG